MNLPREECSFSIVESIRKTCVNNGLDIWNYIFECKSNPIHHDMVGDYVVDEIVVESLTECISNWHIHEYRKNFKRILESAIPR